MAAACVRMLRAASVGSLDTSSAEDDRRSRHGLRLSPLASPPAAPPSPCGTGCPRRRSASRARRQFGAAAIQCGSPKEEATLSPTKAPEKEIKSWRKGARIGQGSYGSVYKAIDKDLGRIFAVKEAIIGNSPDDTKYMDRLEDELKICSTLSHPNIVRYLGHESKEGRLCIFLEYAQGGSLAAILREFGPFQAGLARRATRGALKGLEYLHTRSPPIVHRDIKAANLLVDDHMNVKLADFGCSKRSSSTQSFTTIGSIPWMAPEVVASQAGHGRKADVWSLGCTVLEMFTAEKPWGDGAFDNIMRALWRIGLSQELPPIPEGIDNLGRIFIERCLRRQLDERPSTHDLLHEAFVSRQS